MASPDGEMPLKMTSFLWIQIAHRVAKIHLQSASRLNEPPNKELQNVSSEVTESRATAAPHHASWANGHWKKRWEQSSGPPPQRGQLTGESGNMRCRATRVMRRRRRRSHLKIRIFKGMCHFQINLHLRWLMLLRFLSDSEHGFYQSLWFETIEGWIFLYLLSYLCDVQRMYHLNYLMTDASTFLAVTNFDLLFIFLFIHFLRLVDHIKLKFDGKATHWCSLR